MSDSASQPTDSQPNANAPTSSLRQVARRAFATEINETTYTFKEEDGDRAPVFGLLPTGMAANRFFVVGTLTETNDVGTDSEYWQGRIVDPTGTVFVYAGQYQPEAASMLRSLEPPAYVAVVGKPRTYETDDGDVNVSIRPESITQVDRETRDRWVVETAAQTLERIEAFVEEGDEYAAMAREEYDPDLDTYREAVIDALESLDELDGAVDGVESEDVDDDVGGDDTSDESDE